MLPGHRRKLQPRPRGKPAGRQRFRLCCSAHREQDWKDPERPFLHTHSAVDYKGQQLELAIRVQVSHDEHVRCRINFVRQTGFGRQGARFSKDGRLRTGVGVSESVLLCIDDEVNGLAVRKMVLENEGYRVLTAESGKAGLEIFVLQRVDLVILDYAMPGMNGDQVAIELKRIN